MTARTVVGQDTGGRVVDVAALPCLVRHPEVDDHVGLTRIIFFKDLTVEQRFLRKRLRVRIALAAQLKLRVGIAVLGKRLEMVDH